MPDLVDRAALEETFAEQLGRRGRRVSRDILDLMGDDTRDLTRDEWDEIARQLNEVIQPQLEVIYQRGAGGLYDALGTGADVDQIGTHAQVWARDHADTLTRGLIENTAPRLAGLRTDFLEGRISRAQFRQGVYDLFGTARAEMIAATETTRAAVAAELQAVSGLRQYGLQYVAIWNTANDSLSRAPFARPATANGTAMAGGITRRHTPVAAAG